MDPLAVATIWLHLLATVTLLGYSASLAVVFVPVLRRTLPTAQLTDTLAAVERRALPIVIGSLAIFLATGIYLMGVDPRYAGAGTIGSTWTTVLLVKHLAVIAMVGVGLILDALIVRAAAAADEAARALALGRLTFGLGGMAVLGSFVLLATAVAQTS